ncbi:MAG: DinB family protein [Flavisolibacter sp.]
MSKVDLSQVPQFYHKYIQPIIGRDLEEVFLQHYKSLPSLLSTVEPSKWNFRYAPEKWSIKEVVQHVIDAERIFCYRALTFARKDNHTLNGFDENKYAQFSKADKREGKEILEELSLVQKSSAALFASFDAEQLRETGIANGNSIYVGAIGYIIIGHNLHHRKILEDRYLQ